LVKEAPQPLMLEITDKIVILQTLLLWVVAVVALEFQPMLDELADPAAAAVLIEQINLAAQEHMDKEMQAAEPYS
jgi:hypothetical protein